MTAETKRHALILAVLLAVLAGALWWNVGGSVAPGLVPSGQPAGQRGVPAGAATTPTPIEDVRLDALDAAPPEPAASFRNPFQFGRGRSRAAASETSAPPPAYVEPLPAPVAGTPGGTGAGIPLKFIGVVTEAHPDRTLAVLSDGRSAPFYGRVGDIIEGRYRIVRIGVESIELAHVDGRGQQMIRLSGS